MVAQWFKRVTAGERVQKVWEDDFRVPDCYQYWRGNQRAEPFDKQHERKAVVNLVHPQVRAQLPSLYFYRPFGRVNAGPEKQDVPQEVVTKKGQLLQDQGNYFVRDPETRFRASTFLGLKESSWAFGCVEAGFSAKFVDNPIVGRPPLKETKDTKVGRGVRTVQPADTDGLPLAQEPRALVSEAEAVLDKEIAELRSRLKGERFYVKHIPANQILISPSDKAVLEENDWVGYWEDYDVEDVKRSGAFDNAKNLKPSMPKSAQDKKEEEKRPKEEGEDAAESDKIRLYKLWDLRTNTKIVLAHGHKQFLKRSPFKRLGLKFLRPDIDPYHFRPVPPIYNGLGDQDEHNDSYEYLRKERKQRKARWTYTRGKILAEEIEKFETDEANYIPTEDDMGHSGLRAVEHPSFSQLPLQTLTLSERSFAQSTGVPAEARQAQTQGEKTATQAVIQNTARQVADSFDRSHVAEWLASIIEELVLLALDHMSLPRWIQIHVVPESPLALAEAMKIAQTWKQIKAEELRAAAVGIRWHFEVDVESISPVAQQERLQRLLQMLTFIGNPAQATLLSRAPILLDQLLSLVLAGPMSGVDRAGIMEALEGVVALSQMTARAGAGQPRGISPVPGEPPPSAAGPPLPVEPPAAGPPGPVPLPQRSQ